MECSFGGDYLSTGSRDERFSGRGWAGSYATRHSLWETELPAGTSGAPMTYLADGTQYVVVAIGDPDHEAELIAFSLP